MRVLKLMFAPYFLLGMFGAVVCSSRSAVHPGVLGAVILGAAHVLLIWIAFVLAKRNTTSLSSGALCIGWALAYMAGLLLTLRAMT